MVKGVYESPLSGAKQCPPSPAEGIQLRAQEIIREVYCVSRNAAHLSFGQKKRVMLSAASQRKYGCKVENEKLQIR